MAESLLPNAGMAGRQPYTQYPANPYIQQNYSPQYAAGVEQMYGQQQQNLAATPNLAGQYQQYLQQSPQLEQMQYNQALARLKGQMGTAQQQLLGGAGARRGGGEGGWLMQGQQDLNRQLMAGTGQIASQQAMQNLADQERRQQQYLQYQQGDWANQQGALQSQQGWLAQMMPQEQFNIQFPQQMALQQQQLAQQGAYEQGQLGLGQGQLGLGQAQLAQLTQQQAAELAQQGQYQQGQLGIQQGQLGLGQAQLAQLTEQQRAELAQLTEYQRGQLGIQQGQLGMQGSQLGLQGQMQNYQIESGQRAEQLGWLDRLLAMQNQLGNQYYQGQQDWMGYGANAASNILGGYTPAWLAPYGM